MADFFVLVQMQLSIPYIRSQPGGSALAVSSMQLHGFFLSHDQWEGLVGLFFRTASSGAICWLAGSTTSSWTGGVNGFGQAVGISVVGEISFCLFDNGRSSLSMATICNSRLDSTVVHLPHWLNLSRTTMFVEVVGSIH